MAEFDQAGINPANHDLRLVEHLVRDLEVLNPMTPESRIAMDVAIELRDALGMLAPFVLQSKHGRSDEQVYDSDALAGDDKRHVDLRCR